MLQLCLQAENYPVHQYGQGADHDARVVMGIHISITRLSLRGESEDERKQFFAFT
ncbi:Uncharacterised protein [Escherichia coli]|uniref:Uncharacterized protein n=1 Tax=Escherichia coli TaxID=562 RepID=A0A376L2V3_ECOLX|nr:Uncharacterised protein [Escherichia coli]